MSNEQEVLGIPLNMRLKIGSHGQETVVVQIEYVSLLQLTFSTLQSVLE